MADPLAVIGALAACCDLASLLFNCLKSYAKASEDIADLADRLENDVILLNEFLDFFRIHKDYFRAKNEDGHLDRVVDNLRVRLQKTAHRVEKLGKAGPLDRIRWLGLKSDIIAAADAIHHWSQRFSARLATIPDSMKQELIKSVQRGSTELSNSAISGLAALLKMKTAAAARRDETSLLCLEKPDPPSPTQAHGTQQYHVEPLNVPPSAENNPVRLKEIKLEVAKLADTLQGAGSSQIHILEAYGFFETGTREAPFAIAYILPDGVQEPENLYNLLEQKPRHVSCHGFLRAAVIFGPLVLNLGPVPKWTLRSTRSVRIWASFMSRMDVVQPLFIPLFCLMHDTYVDFSQPLEARLQLAVSVTTAVAYLHAMSFVHKSIRSSNILLTYPVPAPPSPTVSDLTSTPRRLTQGTDLPQIGTPYLVGFSYARRGTARSTGSSRADWQKEIYRHPERQAAELGIDPEVYYKPYHDVYSLGVVLLELGLWERLDTTYEAKLKRATRNQRRDGLIDLASKHLPAKVGSTFAGIVRRCLEVDTDTDGSEEQMTVQNVLEELDEIRF